MKWKDKTEELKKILEELLQEKARIEAELQNLETEYLFWGKYTIKNIEEAKKDSDIDIRLEAYRVLGFIEEAKKDANWSIRLEAELYFRVKKAQEEDEQ